MTDAAESPFRTLPLDARTSDVGLLRFWAAVASVIGAVWLAATRPPVWAWLGVVSAGFISIFWFRRWVRSRVETTDPTRSYLELTANGFHLSHAGEVERVAWEHVRAVEADEERVAVRVEVAERGDPLYVEPTFGGLGLYELESAMQAAREASPSYAA